MVNDRVALSKCHHHAAQASLVHRREQLESLRFESGSRRRDQNAGQFGFFHPVQKIAGASVRDWSFDVLLIERMFKAFILSRIARDTSDFINWPSRFTENLFDFSISRNPRVRVGELPIYAMAHFVMEQNIPTARSMNSLPSR